MINAGKSALNEDQACCEVVVARRRPMSYCPPSTPSRTPSAKRRNSLPNGEGLGLRLDYSKLGEVRASDLSSGKKGNIGIYDEDLVIFKKYALAGLCFEIQTFCDRCCGQWWR